MKDSLPKLSPPIIVILGRQGSGKGTQCEMLEAASGIIHISTGVMLREDDGSEASKRAKEVMAAGELVGDDIMFGLVKNRLSKPDVAKAGAVLDGFPRNPVQAEALTEILESLEYTLDMALNIDVPRDMVIERMLERGREDDTKEAIERRLEIYEEQTAPLRDWFRKKGLLVEIDGTGSPEEVFESFSAQINTLLNTLPHIDETAK